MDVSCQKLTASGAKLPPRDKSSDQTAGRQAHVAVAQTLSGAAQPGLVAIPVYSKARQVRALRIWSQGR